MARGGADLLRRAMAITAREELDQARAETVERLAPVARSTGMMAAGGVLAAYGAVYVVQGIVRALSTRMPPWLAYVLTGAAIALGGAALLESGRRQVTSPDATSGNDAAVVESADKSSV
jgi:hypothetical protein